MSGISPTPKKNTNSSLSQSVLNQIADELMTLGDLTLRFAQVERAPQISEGRRETDVEHSFHLGLSATELAARYFPELDVGLVAQFANVHDLPEVYTGDVWTFIISPEERRKKEEAEAKATERLLAELPPYTASLLKRYEQQTEPEARFVRYVDKSMPAIIYTVAYDSSTFLEDQGITSLDELHKHRGANTERLQQMFPEFPLMHEIRLAVANVMDQRYFPTES